MYPAGFQLLFGREFFEFFLAWRMVTIEGRMGGGKTLFSVVLAKWLYDHNLIRGVYSNFPIDPSYVPAVQSCVQTCIILDEAWAFADARDSARGYKGYGAMARKLGSFFVSPGVYAVDKRMRPLRCERSWDVWVIDSWLYEWADVRNQSGHFLLRGYQSVFNMYDHRYIPSDDAGILETAKADIAALSRSQRKVFVVGAPEKAVDSPYANPMSGPGGRGSP